MADQPLERFEIDVSYDVSRRSIRVDVRAPEHGIVEGLFIDDRVRYLGETVGSVIGRAIEEIQRRIEQQVKAEEVQRCLKDTQSESVELLQSSACSEDRSIPAS